VSRFQVVVEPKRKQGRDPRFDNISGTLNKELFGKSYQFLIDQKKEEVNILENELHKKKKYKAEEMEKLRTALSTNKNEIHRWKQMELVDSVKHEHKKGMKMKEEKGKTPFYLKKSELKKQVLEIKFDDLAQKKKLEQKIIEKKKKASSKLYRDYKKVVHNSEKRHRVENK